MIKNEKQYSISKKTLAEIEARIKEKKPKVAPGSKEEGAVNSLIMFRKEVRDEIKQYESLKAQRSRSRKRLSLVQLPNVLIEHKISKGLTQKQFAGILGIKEQQLQRYEADHYKSVSFGRLLEYIKKANIKIELEVKED